MSSTAIARPEREEQALREVGHTEVARAVGTLLVVVFLLTIAGVSVWQGISDVRNSSGRTVLPRLSAFVAQLPGIAGSIGHSGPFAANRALADEIEGFEEAVEDESVLRDWILSPAQSYLSRLGGVGNEQSYLGRQGWLYFRPDFDYVSGPGFLEPRVLQRKRIAREAEPDPLPAILQFARDLAVRDIELVVVPTPVKLEIHPEFLGRASAPVRNPSFAELARRLETQGVTVFDPSPILLRAKAQETRPQYLRADTHWTPAAVEWVASELARDLIERVSWTGSAGSGYGQRVAVVEAVGDSVELLGLPEGQTLFAPERVEVLRVFESTGRPWRSSPEAEILLLGDSFTNIYSDSSLGWGSGAGFAERLSFHLGRPVDRIARNAGGAASSRQALVRALESGQERLAGKRVVVYQFANRELSAGDWKILPLP